VLLRIQPRAGDTMYTRFEQTVEMIGTRNVHSVDTTMTSRMDIMILSHSLVQGSDGHGTTVLAITDSVFASIVSFEIRVLTPGGVPGKVIPRCLRM